MTSLRIQIIVVDVLVQTTICKIHHPLLILHAIDEDLGETFASELVVRIVDEQVPWPWQDSEKQGATKLFAIESRFFVYKLYTV